MNAGVLREVGAVGECLWTLGTLVRLRFPHVDLSVELEVSLAAEDLQT